MIDGTTGHPTRRELHRAPRRRGAHRAARPVHLGATGDPVTRPARADRPGAATVRPAGPRHRAAARTGRRSPLLVPVAALAVTAVLLTGAVDQVRLAQDRQTTRAVGEAIEAQVLAHVAADDRRARTDRAGTVRLTEQADAWATSRLDAALAEAKEVLRSAEAVSARTAQVVDPSALAPLEDATATLGEVIAGSPDPARRGADDAGTLLAAAKDVARLAGQVRATADARVAEAALAAARTEAIVSDLAERTAVAAAAANGRIPASALCGVGFDDAVRLRCDAAVALERLNSAYRSHFGSNLRVQGSYRDYDAQVATKQLRGDLAAEPGTSNHGRGLAVDLGGTGTVGQFDTPVYLWLKQHAGDVGWFHPPAMEPGGSGPQEPWHWEYGTG